MECPKCQTIDIFVNDTLCGCEESQCIKKPCTNPVKPNPDLHPCHVIKEAKDDCGCLVYKPEKEPYCIPFNKAAKNAKCESGNLPASCMKNRVKANSDACGCDTNECVVEEMCVEKYESKNCPKNHYMISGVTQCGRARDVCIK